MKTNPLIGCVVLGILLAACSGVSQAQALQASDLVRVAAFNIQVFGRTKIEKEAAVDTIVKIIHRYDLILIQEIRDSSETAIYTLLDNVNSMTNDPYNMTVSERLGRTSSKEQYAYMYRASKMELVSAYVYNDIGDRFEREPYIALFKSSRTAVPEFAIAGIHTTPSEAETEVDLLVDVHQDILSRMETENVIFAGDFNSDCSYVTSREWADVRLRSDPQYVWLIDDEEDTTVSSTDCAYDRFVVAGDQLHSAIVPCSATTFKYDAEYGLDESQAKEVSDHYPIEFSFLPGEFKESAPSLTIAAFNIQVFGQTKASKDHVMDVLAKTLKRYDLILIQEIRDAAETAIYKLLDLCNKDNADPFEITVSDRLGRTSSKEQYAYMYRPSKLELKSSLVYDDSQGDVFQREPFIAHFKSPNTYVKEFVIAGIHTQPDAAVQEIDALVDVYSAIQQRFGIEDVILTGDFNAECSYVSKSRLSNIRLYTDPRFCWLISHDVDTTVKSTDCAYDRIVIAGQKMHEGVLPHSASVFRFDLEYGLDEIRAAEVSDHYPVEIQLRESIGSDQDLPDYIRKQEL